MLEQWVGNEFQRQILETWHEVGHQGHFGVHQIGQIFAAPTSPVSREEPILDSEAFRSLCPPELLSRFVAIAEKFPWVQPKRSEDKNG